MPETNPPAPKIGSFEDAELQNLRRIAALTPAQRVKLVCSMDRIARRSARGKTKTESKAQSGERAAPG